MDIFKKKSFTIMIVPHTDSKPVHFHITMPFIMRISTLVCFVGLLFSLFLIDYNNVKLKLFSVAPLAEELERERERLTVEKSRQEEDMAKIKGIMTKLKDVEDRFKNITGFESKMRKGGQGGVTYSDKELSKRIRASEYNGELEGKSGKILENIKDLEESATYQSLKLDEFSDFLEDKKGLLESTPMIWPVKGGHISGRFGYRQSPFNSKKTEFHTGLDISANMRTPVIATAKGKVIYAGRLPGLGNAIKIRHGNGISTLYGHNSKLLVKSGELVERGQKIALSGNSGVSTGPHVHYEIQKQGYFENPVKYILNL